MDVKKTILILLFVVIVVFACLIYRNAQSPTISVKPNTTGNSTSTASAIQQLNAPGSVSLQQDGIAEIRNKHFYFTLQDLFSSSATIQITPVGCWNSFPSYTPPQMRCMIAVFPIKPQSLYVGQTYSAANYSIKLTQIGNGIATFLVGVTSSQ